MDVTNELLRRMHQGIKDNTGTNPRKEIKADPRVGKFDPTKIKIHFPGFLNERKTVTGELYFGQFSVIIESPQAPFPEDPGLSRIVFPEL